MAEPFRDPQHVANVCGQLNGDTLPIIRAAAAQIHGYIDHCTGLGPASLRIVHLVVDAAKYIIF